MVSFPTLVLVADDGSPESDRAVATAARLTEATGSRLALVHVKVRSPSVTGVTAVPAQEERLNSQGEAFLRRRREELAERGIPSVHTELRLTRRPERSVLRVSEELRAGLIVVGVRGARSADRLVLGDLSLPLARDAHCSVLVVRDGRHGTAERTIDPEQG
ncbi:universal stress protein [Nocardiopsis kunsanensis]|uniref:Universal stress protein n=1 Tax=Nocardiopsis kunsanensis TaxID=141693 RepID=A0A919CHC8_9ACTN|nr:universal stress protein [Nocardiopsis kunsanensis]GHD25729.1 universal stress protein [Nocardiopsis kunsanensis]